jgi:hypothetical protein
MFFSKFIATVPNQFTVSANLKMHSGRLQVQGAAKLLARVQVHVVDGKQPPSQPAASQTLTVLATN